MPKVTQEHLDRRRQEILEGARRCFARLGYEGATVRQLEQEIGLSRGAIFNYFFNKQELFFAIVEQEVDRSPQSWDDGGWEELVRSIAEQDPDWHAVHFEFARLVRTQPDFREVWMRRLPALRLRVGRSLDDAQRTGEYRDDVPSETLHAFLGLIADGLALRVMLGGEVDVDAILKLVDDAVRPQSPAPSGERAKGRARLAF